MPYKNPAPEDPMELVGVVLPGDADSMREMAYVFAGEFSRMGYKAKEILSIFKNPFYAGAHGAYRALGGETIRSIIDECVNVWERPRSSSIPSIPSVSSTGHRDSCPVASNGRNDQTDQRDEIDPNTKEER